MGKSVIKHFLKKTKVEVEEFNKTLTEASVPQEYIGLSAGFSLAVGEEELDNTNSIME
ncbi:MAG: hypothetical protein ACEPOZ_01960 [Marinifilaceae bacterium]